MIELLRTIRIVGLRKLLRLSQARRWGWDGILRGFYTTRTIQTLLNVGFFDEFQEKKTVNLEAFAAQKHLDLRVLQPLCASLFALRILNKDGSDYTLGSKGVLLVEVARGWFESVYGYEGLFHDLEALLTGKKEYGKDLTRRWGAIARGSSAMESIIYYPLAVDVMNKSGAVKILDLGCGDGEFLRYLCQSNTQFTGYGVDIFPDSIDVAEKKTREAGLEDRIHFSLADISKLEEPPAVLREADIAISIFVLHEILFLGEDVVIQFLQSFQRLFPGLPLIVIEAIRPTVEQMRRKPGMAVQYYLHHDLSNQTPVGREKWRDLFTKAGWESVEERYLRFARTSIYVLSNPEREG